MTLVPPPRQRSQLPTSTSWTVAVAAVVYVVLLLRDVVATVVVLRRSKRACVVRARAHALPRMRIERTVSLTFSVA